MMWQRFLNFLKEMKYRLTPILWIGNGDYMSKNWIESKSKETNNE